MQTVSHTIVHAIAKIQLIACVNGTLGLFHGTGKRTPQRYRFHMCSNQIEYTLHVEWQISRQNFTFAFAIS